MLTIEVDDSQIQDFVKKSPKRADWALSEALKAIGGSIRKKIIAFIKKGGAGWPALSPATLAMKKKLTSGAARYRTSPLEILARLIRFKYGKSKGVPRVTIGFFDTKSWFKHYYGVGAATIAKLHEKGGRSYKHGTRPMRPMIEPVWKKEKDKIPGYVEKKFFSNFFSKKNRKLGI